MEQYRHLFENNHFIQYFHKEIVQFDIEKNHAEEILRRFSFSGDGQLDGNEFRLAINRLGLYQHEIDKTHQNMDVNTRMNELFRTFCLSATGKLDIDIFCRVMTIWADTIKKKKYFTDSNQGDRCEQNIAETIQSGDSSEQNNLNCVDSILGIEKEAFYYRLIECISNNISKFKELLARMDIANNGRISSQEFELALQYIGVSISSKELDQLYKALPSRCIKQHINRSRPVQSYTKANDEKAIEILYLNFLAYIGEKIKNETIYSPITHSISAPKLNGQSRLWDRLVNITENIRRFSIQFGSLRNPYLPPETFRQLLFRSGLNLSNSDYAVLRVQLRPFTNEAGAISVQKVLAALHQKHHPQVHITLTDQQPCISSGKQQEPQHNDKVLFNVAQLQNSENTSVMPTDTKLYKDKNDLKPAGQCSTNIYNRYGKKCHAMNGRQYTMSASSQVYDALHVQDTATSTGTQLKPRQSRTLVDEHEKRVAPHLLHTQTNVESEISNVWSPGILTKKIFTRIEQLKTLGSIALSASVESFFPGDRFGRITRGDLRQGLNQLGIIAKSSLVESIFMALDTKASGYVRAQDLHALLHENTSPQSCPDGTMDVKSIDEIKNIHVAAPNHGETTNIRFTQLPRSVQKVLENILEKLPELTNICRQLDVTNSKTITQRELMYAFHEIGILAAPQDLQTALHAIANQDLTTRSNTEVDKANKQNGVYYEIIGEKLTALCSELLTPKNTNHHQHFRPHLTSTSVLLEPFASKTSQDSRPSNHQHTGGMNRQARQREIAARCDEANDALWNTSRRRQLHNHAAAKSSFHISDQFQLWNAPKLTEAIDVSQTPSNSHKIENLRKDNGLTQHSHRMAIISILDQLNERHREVKNLLDQYPNHDKNGKVQKDDLRQIFMSARLNLPFATEIYTTNHHKGPYFSSKLSVGDFVDVLYPTESISVGYVELLKRLRDLMTELVKPLPADIDHPPGHIQKAHISLSPRRLHNPVDHLFGAIYSSNNNTSNLQSSSTKSTLGSPNFLPLSISRKPVGGIILNDADSLCKKLMDESRLQGLLASEDSQKTAAVLIRHAFKGINSREMIPSSETGGEFEAICRIDDVKYVCSRLGLDLDVGELQYLLRQIDMNASGYISSSQLLQFFIHITASTYENSKIPFPQVQGIPVGVL